MFQQLYFESAPYTWQILSSITRPCKAATAVALPLSGATRGTQGLRIIKQYGGGTIAKDPQTARMPFMPLHAIGNGVADQVLDVNQIEEFIISWCRCFSLAHL